MQDGRFVGCDTAAFSCEQLCVQTKKVRIDEGGVLCAHDKQ